MFAKNEKNKKILLTSKGLNDPLGEKLYSRQIHAGENDKALLISIEEYGVGHTLIAACEKMGFKTKNIELCETKEGILNLLAKVQKVVKQRDNPLFSIIYIGEGNTYQLLDLITRYDKDGHYSKDFLNFVKREYEKGAVYCGSSAGAAIACKDIGYVAAFAKKELNFSDVKDKTGIGIFPGAVIPHYSSEDFIRYFYHKNITDIKQLQNKYEQLAWIDNEDILIWYPYQVESLLDRKYNETYNIKDMINFFHIASGQIAKILIYGGDGFDVSRSLLDNDAIEVADDFIIIGTDQPYLIPLSGTRIHKIYSLRNYMYGFRVEFDQSHYDIMINLFPEAFSSLVCIDDNNTFSRSDK